ncbi:MAG: metallophosphoesterase [Deltaproteobacteria bacterium]|nr:metallophosphoesterase [Deltaproteobacteria bacterium]MBW2120955.1 metallophosphoesterase [Deltaproteobacteria bacterium]
MKILFSTDVHGSDVCFRKFLNALKIYKVDVGILLGDLCGKMINPIIKQPDGTYIVHLLGERRQLKTEEELQTAQKELAAMGNYYILTDPEEVEVLKAEGKTVAGRIDERATQISLSAGKVETLFKKLALERLESWMRLAEERLEGSNIEMFMAPGNDDIFEMDEVLDRSTYVVNADNRKVDVKGHEMITLSWSNPTPWDTPRECSEEELEEKIEKLVSQVQDMETAIFNFHAPPHGTMLDECAKLSEDLVPSTEESISAGSVAVLNAIKKYQPLLGLHGHIHESRAVQKIGRTTCINPGSEYTEAILRAVLITLEKNKVKNYMFVGG